MKRKGRPKGRKRVGTRSNLKKYTYLGCPLTKNRSPWCFRMCELHDDGTGYCGRIAPHGFKSHIQLGIEEFNKKKAESSASSRSQEQTATEDS